MATVSVKGLSPRSTQWKGGFRRLRCPSVSVANMGA